MGLDGIVPHTPSDRIDNVILHPVIGPVLMTLVLFLVFQAVFAWAEAPMAWIESATSWVGANIGNLLPEGWLRSLIVDGVIAGAGGVLVFLPQIVILFFFILVLEESGYLPRAAFLLDRLMGSIGLSGRSFIPLLSSFACAIPGIMATRTIPNLRDRLTTIMLAPLMTCSARLPVYALLIGAFIPRRDIGVFNLQGLVLFGLYLLGVAGAIIVALGQDHAGLFSNNDELAQKLSAAGTATGEKVWRMPLDKAFRREMDSVFADIRNVGNGRYGGSCTAAAFLSEFIDDGRAWAHLDIAGVAMSKTTPTCPVPFASGYGVRLLNQFVEKNFG